LRPILCGGNRSHTTIERRRCSRRRRRGRRRPISIRCGIFVAKYGIFVARVGRSGGGRRRARGLESKLLLLREHRRERLASAGYMLRL